MNAKQQLHSFIDSIVTGDMDAAKAAFQPYVTMKSKSMIGAPTRTIKESFALKEFFGDSAIRLHGNDVLVNGKKVGVIKNDLDDFDSGINFIDISGTYSKEFDTTEQLYSFLGKRYTRDEG